jgi:hypothetical protein
MTHLGPEDQRIMRVEALELELQQELQRFASQFAARIIQATEGLQRSVHQKIRNEALKKNLVYISSAMEIASGPSPSIGLLDMVVLIRLSRSTLEKHWIPTLYRSDGAELAEIFARSDEELAALVHRTLKDTQRAQLDSVIDSWLADNPTQVRVEGIRLGDFSSVAGDAAAERARRASGLLSSVKTAAQTANQALLLAERGFFLVHRLPFLWRLQARVGAREILDDVIARLAGGPDALPAEDPLPARAIARRGFRHALSLGAGWAAARLARA